jgi:hypothetical protein
MWELRPARRVTKRFIVHGRKRRTGRPCWTRRAVPRSKGVRVATGPEPSTSRAGVTKPKYSCSTGSRGRRPALGVLLATAKLTNKNISPTPPTPVAMWDVSTATARCGTLLGNSPFWSPSFKANVYDSVAENGHLYALAAGSKLVRMTTCLPRSAKAKNLSAGCARTKGTNEDFQRFLLVLCHTASASWLGKGDIICQIVLSSGNANFQQADFRPEVICERLSSNGALKKQRGRDANRRTFYLAPRL